MLCMVLRQHPSGKVQNCEFQGSTSPILSYLQIWTHPDGVSSSLQEPIVVLKSARTRSLPNLGSKKFSDNTPDDLSARKK
mmetsp:Transcript_1171/g.2459  ORF Transcript_1171/g.2459 Transcript_1171/m.2459 type:complete len:80 (-) Transcript_1171:1148-1387(-)